MPSYTERQYQYWDIAAMQLAILLSLKAMKSLKIGVGTHLQVTTLFSEQYHWHHHRVVTAAIAVYVGCICDPVISVRVLHLLHNNSVDLQLIGLLLWYYTTCRYHSTATLRLLAAWALQLYSVLLSCLSLSTLYCVGFLNMCLWQVSLVGRSWSLVGACDLQLGLLLQCIRQSNGSIFRDRSQR